MNRHLKETMQYLDKAIESIQDNELDALTDACEVTLRRGNKLILTGLGKNVPVCEKFVGTMNSLGLAASFMHTNSAVHGDLGMVRPGDLVIVLTKSGSTAESIYLIDLLLERNCQPWLLSFCRTSELCKRLKNSLIINLEHEGDQWNILPNNSTTLNLIVLQAIAMTLSERLNIRLEDFKPNHPGGAIGGALKDA